VPRKTKTSSKEAETTGSAAPESNGAAEKPARRAPAKARKATAKKATKRAAKTTPAATIEPTDEQIRLRAYFIAERRHRLALPGNADSDWLEAKRQLETELLAR
jgi:hypothetical protein